MSTILSTHHKDHMCIRHTSTVYMTTTCPGYSNARATDGVRSHRTSHEIFPRSLRRSDVDHSLSMCIGGMERRKHTQVSERRVGHAVDRSKQNALAVAVHAAPVLRVMSCSKGARAVHLAACASDMQQRTPYFLALPQQIERSSWNKSTLSSECTPIHAGPAPCRRQLQIPRSPTSNSTVRTLGVVDMLPSCTQHKEAACSGWSVCKAEMSWLASAWALHAGWDHGQAAASFRG